MKKLSLFLLFLIFPLHMVNAADTLGELKQELKDLQNEKAQNDASKNKTQSQIQNPCHHNIHNWYLQQPSTAIL